MKISELIAQLEDIKKDKGDLKVVVQSLSHYFPPEPRVKELAGQDKHYVLLNP